MKQIKLTFILTVLMSMVGLQAFAGFDTSTKIQVGDLYYYLDNDNLQAEVTSMSSGNHTGALVIPSSINYEAKTYSVTSIGGNAFNNCSGLTSVTIPNSVTSIGNNAFYNCSGLTSVTIPESVTSIGGYAFCKTGLTSVTIPNSVTSIGGEAYSDCSGLTSMKVESGNTKYDSRGNCNAIIETASNTLVVGCKSTVIPNSVTSIGYHAFAGCSGLTSITIPNSVTSIRMSAFGDCKGLTSVTIGNSVTSIDYAAFCNTGLTSITIPNSVTYIGMSAFSSCPGLTSMKVESGNTKYDSRDNCNAIIETASNKLINGCKRTVIPSSVTSIGSEAFEKCTGLTSVVIPNSVTSIGYWAFSGCSGLKDVYCYPTEVPLTDRSAFKDVTTNNVALHVLSSSIYNYKVHEVWGQFKFGSFLDGTPFTYSVDGLSKLKMLVPTTEHKLNITAEEGWKVVALTVNDESKMSELKDNVLTINISADTEVKVTFGWANEANLYTEDAVTGIATIEGEGVKVQAKDGQIWVDGAAGKTVRLYTVGGALMTTVTPKADMTGKFSVAAGTYIVQVGNKAAKVVVK